MAATKLKIKEVRRKMFKKVKAQSFVDYSLLIAGVTTALLAGRAYLSQSLKGSYRQYSQSVAAGAAPFSPRFSKYDKITQSLSTASDSNNDGSRAGKIKTLTQEGEEFLGEESEYQTLTTDQTDRITRVIAGEIEVDGVWDELDSFAGYFDGGEDNLARDVFRDERIGGIIDFRIREDSIETVVDDFSGRRLSDE